MIKRQESIEEIAAELIRSGNWQERIEQLTNACNTLAEQCRDHGERVETADTLTIAIREWLSSKGIETDPSDFRLYDPHRDEYGQRSLLIITHEGTDAARAISLDGAYNAYARPDQDCYGLYNQFVEYLDKMGVYIEQCTRWYSAIYADEVNQ